MPNTIDYSTRKSDKLAIYIGLDSIKTNGNDSAKNGYQVGAGNS